MPGSRPAIGQLESCSAGLPARTPRFPAQNPLHFVQVQSPLYQKAEQQIKLVEGVKITRETLKEGEEEWQSNLDNWKSRRRKVSEKVFQRAEEMRQIEAEEQLRKEQLLQQQKKIKKFSEIVEKKSQSYNLDLYIGPGDDSGLGGTPEPDDLLDSQVFLLQSDASKGLASEAESVDSDISKTEKVSTDCPVFMMTEKEPPKVPQKPRLKKSVSISHDPDETICNELFQPHLPHKVFVNCFAEPSDVEGNAADTEATSSEEDTAISGPKNGINSGLENFHERKRDDFADSVSDLSEDNDLEKSYDKLRLYSTSAKPETDKKNFETKEATNGYHQSFQLCLRPDDSRGFGFTFKGGKDLGCPAYVESVIKGGPAEDVGVKVGDKIIYLNGELTAEFSHASLLLSIKQAAYAGKLDIVISRSENCEYINSETRTAESRKGKSFAEKLAIFTAGINTPTLNLEEPKIKSTETKKESLVLRRCSAFENGKTENVNPSNRRASCISQPHETKVLEKRHSLNLNSSQNVITDSSIFKKGPPPPVPVKPKIKSKVASLELNKFATNTNDETKNISLPNNSIHSEQNPLQEKSEIISTSLDADSQFKQLSSDILPTGKTVPTSINNSHDSEDLLDSYNTTHHSSSENCGSENVVGPISDFNETDTAEMGVASFKANEIQLTQDLYHKNMFETFDEDLSIFNDTEVETRVFPKENINEKDSDLNTIMAEFSEELIDNTSSEHIEECTYAYSDNINVDIYSENDILKGTDSDINLVYHSELDSRDANKSQETESINISTLEESEIENKTNAQTSSSSLCLSLEKIDEDDAISASTTTSSDTPDTETVIESLPTNLSPLPNDEDSLKVVTCPKELPFEPNMSNKVFTCETNNEIEFAQNHEENCLNANDAFENKNTALEDSENFAPEIDVMDKTFYDNQPDDEYARELDESLDQITSLDIIDRIEQSLMDQLQKEDSYEDLSPNLNSSLDSPWLYYSEESELLEDLTPRNLQPPREPPPPPPPPELEEDDDEITSSSRSNSTKRLKKELWRRRSDFLGLDSPDAIDVDVIPPPPPVLEELLKQEREQTQWLEKSMSLIEPERENISYLNESTCVDSGNYSNNDPSDYFEENGDSSKEIALEFEPNQWKRTTVEEADFQDFYGLNYESASETLMTVIESVKQCGSPVHKAKQNVQNLGAAPKAKIMDSARWITEKPNIEVDFRAAEERGRCSLPPWDEPPDTLEPEVHQCSCCGKGLCEGSAMGIEALRLYFHIGCFRCCLCNIQLGNGSCGTDVQVRNNQLYCPSCFTVD